ncbi:MAG: hypothetical protein QE285_10115 [Aquabacterium sp.]|nr:hypothetical protein [Aquabacterium sp.]
MQATTIQPWGLDRGAVTGTGAGPATSAKGADDLARQFEQLLVRQLLTQVRASALSQDGDSNSPSAGYLQMADDQLASIVAGVGGLGLGASVRRWMQGTQAYQASAPAPTGLPR